MDFASIILVAAGGVLGIVIGMWLALYIQHKKYYLPEEEKKDIWKRIEEVTEEQAEIKAKKRALRKAFKAGTIPESVFVSKTTYYDTLKEHLDDELELLIKRIASPYLEEELKKRDKKLREISDIAILTSKIKEMEKSKKRMENEKDKMHIEIRNLEEEAKAYLAERNRIEKRYEEQKRKNRELEERIEQLEKEREELMDRIATEPSVEEKIKNLEHENKILREALERTKSKAKTLSKQIAVMETILNRHIRVLEKLEEKTADDIKKAVKPHSKAIKDIVKAYDTPEKAYRFVKEHITEVPTSFNYWLSVEEVLKLRAGDLQDKAILLCSMLRALGKDAKVIVVELKNGIDRALVYSDGHLLDFNREYDDITGDEEECLRNYSFDRSRIRKVLYAFNDKLFERGG